MAFKVGGLEGINKAIECQNAATCEYSSGLQVSGIFTEVITDENNSPIYLRTTGKTALAFRDKELEGHGVDYHKDGFGSPDREMEADVSVARVAHKRSIARARNRRGP